MLAAFVTSTMAIAAPMSGLMDASKLQDEKVTDSSGKKIGEVKEVLIDPEIGTIRYIVVQMDKEMNLEDRKIAVPWSAFDLTQSNENRPELSLNATKEKLETAPSYGGGDAARLYSEQASAPIYEYWSVVWFPTPRIATGMERENPGSTAQGVSQAGPTPPSTETPTDPPSEIAASPTP